MFANEPHLQHFRAIQIVHAVPLFQPLKCSTFLLFSQVLLSCVSKLSFTRPRLMKNSKNFKNNFLLLSVLMFPFSHQYFQTRSSNENSRNFKSSWFYTVYLVSSVLYFGKIWYCRNIWYFEKVDISVIFCICTATGFLIFGPGQTTTFCTCRPQGAAHAPARSTASMAVYRIGERVRGRPVELRRARSRLYRSRFF